MPMRCKTVAVAMTFLYCAFVGVILIIAVVMVGCVSTPIKSERIKTWIIAPTGMIRNSSGVAESKGFLESVGYRCYSESDDLIWRDSMALFASCCEGH